MNLIKKVMLSNASTPSFGPYAQLSSVVSRYTPSSELNIQTKIEHRII